MNRPVFREIPADAIRYEESPYRFRFNPADHTLTASVRRTGLLAPPGVIGQAPDEYVLLYGSRRLAAAREAGLASIPVMVFDKTLPPPEALAVILADNDRTELHPLDRLLLMDTGRRLTGMDERAFAAAWRSVAGEPVNYKTLALARTLTEAEERLKKAVYRDRLPVTAGGELARFGPGDRAAVLDLIIDGGMELSRSGFEEALRLLTDAAVMKKREVGDILRDAGLPGGTGDGGMTPQQQGAHLLAYLRQLRYPDYSRHLARYEKEKAAAEGEYRGRARFSVPRFFENPQISLTLTASDPAALAGMLEHFSEKAGKGALDTMFGIAAGRCP